MLTIAGVIPRERLAQHLFVTGDPKLERIVLERLKSESNGGALKTLKETLASVESAEVRSALLEAYRAETQPERRQALAWVVGSNWNEPELRTTVFEALSDPDPKVVEAILNRLQLEDLEDPQERNLVASALRSTLLSDAPNDLRAQAALAMVGTRDPQDVRILIDVLAAPDYYFVQIRAMEALPKDKNFREASPDLWNEAVNRLLAYALDTSKEGWPRGEAALAAMTADQQWRKRLTSAQIKSIETLIGPKAWPYDD